MLGDTRKVGGILSGEGHAWNAVEVEGAWYLVDVTWDAGRLSGDEYEAHYRTDYIFTPPSIFVGDHLPDDPAWQLSEAPISRGEFARRPMMKPLFYRHGFELLAPTRSQVTATDSISVRVRNPRARFLSARVESESGAKNRCQVSEGREVTVRCDLQGSGTFDVLLFGNTERYGDYDYVGSLQAVVP